MQDQIFSIQKFTRHECRFDAIIVFGYGPVLPGPLEGTGRLNLFGHINSLSAGMLYDTWEIRTIIPTGGETGGSDKPSEAYLIAQLLRSRFDIPLSAFVLEEKATDTITNLVHVANIIDKEPEAYGRLIFVGLGYHLPRIREISSLVGLGGHFVAAESILSTRSEHHRKFLLDLLSPERESYAKILADQETWLAWLTEMPGLWLREMAAIDSPIRLRKILETERIQPYLYAQGIDAKSESLESLRSWLSSIPRPESAA
jgi:uncharacterized SAM-binding protein YcdF (DUF218 family)